MSIKTEAMDYKNRSYLSSVEAAKYLDVSVGILHNLSNKQVVKSQTATSGQIRFDLKELKRYEENIKSSMPKKKIEIEIEKANALEDLIQDVIFYYSITDFQPIKRIYENMEDVERTCRLLKDATK